MTERLAVLLLAAVIAACDRTPPAPVAMSAPSRHAPVYQCPMHPQVVRHEPGTCPICSMALQRVDDAGVASGVPGHVAFSLPVERQQLIGVTQATAEVRTLIRDLRTAATVADDPGLYEAWIEYREALRTRGALRAGSVRDASTTGDTLVRAAALKLRRQGVGEREIAALAELDPTSLILPGARVWIYAQVFEEDAPLLRAGMPVSVEIPSEPGRTLTSTILAIDPTVAPESRTVRVRALVTTPDASLRPGAFAIATFRVSLGDRLAIPREAVLDAGMQRLVFVVTDGTHFDPRAVTLGRRADDYVEVLDGVAAGERVVTSANFLIDSESRLKAAVAAFGAAPAHQH